MNVTLKKKNGDVTVPVAAPIRLLDFLQEENLPVSSPCGGNGTCGKCKVLAYGGLSALTEREKSALSADELRRGTRLACQARILSDAMVDCRAPTVRPAAQPGYRLPPFSYSPVFRENSGLIAVFDIGTTTVAGYLYRRDQWIASALCNNPQARYGADVITRIQNAGEHLPQMSALIRESIRELTAEFGVSGALDGMVVTGNTVMLHLYCRYDPSGMACFPYTPRSLFGMFADGTCFPPCISSFIGADTVCAVLASGMTDSGKTSLLIDVGTNGETVLWHDGRLYAASGAAGPALEGAGISCGTLAVPGAVDRVSVLCGNLVCATIGRKKPVGLCGSGVIDAVAALLRLKAVDRSGYLPERYPLCGGIFLSPEDIRQVQLAKSAVRTGIDSLLDHCGLTYDAIESLYIAGGFGSSLNLSSACRIGMIPEALAGRAKGIGNAAAAGAALIGLCAPQWEKAVSLAAGATVVDLAAREDFLSRYVENMAF